MDQAECLYQKERIAHWDRISPLRENPNRPGAFYQKLLRHYYQFFIPPSLRILEIGCGHGELLSALKPSLGIGIDFSDAMLRTASGKYPGLFFIRADAHTLCLRETFDVIILSDLVNDVWDVQGIFKQIRKISHPGTRVILNFYNNLWRIPLSVVRRMGLEAEVLEQNWLSPHDVVNLLELEDFEVIRYVRGILLPLEIPGVSVLVNRYLAHLPPFCWFTLTNFVMARPVKLQEQSVSKEQPSVSIIIPARNEAGNIESILRRLPYLSQDTELIFVEGGSTDQTFETIQQVMEQFPERKCSLFRQSGKGKGDAVRLGFEKARGDALMILDADMTVAPEDLTRFFDALVSGKGDFINGVRLVYPLENQSMRFFNILGNKFFSLVFSWLLGQPIKDTLCGTKVLRKKDYELIAENRDYFGDFDPFGDFDLLFGAAKLNMKIAEMPIRYRSRTYGETNIDRWRHGWLLLKMVFFAARRIKFV